MTGLGSSWCSCRDQKGAGEVTLVPRVELGQCSTGEPCVPVPQGALALGRDVVFLFQARLRLEKILRKFTVCLTWSLGTWGCAYCSGGCCLGSFLTGFSSFAHSSGQQGLCFPRKILIYQFWLCLGARGGSAGGADATEHISSQLSFHATQAVCPMFTAVCGTVLRLWQPRFSPVLTSPAKLLKGTQALAARAGQCFQSCGPSDFPRVASAISGALSHKNWF